MASISGLSKMSGKSYGAVKVTNAQNIEEAGIGDLGEHVPLLQPDAYSQDAASSNVFNKNAFRDFWSLLTFDWISPLLQLGNVKGQLDVSDLNSMPLPRDCETGEVYDVFSTYWEKEIKRSKESRTRKSVLAPGNQSKGDDGEKNIDKTNSVLDDLEIEFDDYAHPQYKPSLIRVLYKSFGADFLRAGILKFIHDANLFVGPQVLNRLIQFIRSNDADLSEGVTLTIIVTVSQVVMSLCLRHYFYKCYTCGLRIRTAIVIAIYRKSLVLSLKERHAHGGRGEIANLVGIDAQRMQDLMTYLHAVWYSFFQISLAVYFLWGQVGPSCLAGVIVIIVLIPTTKFVAAWLAKIQKLLMKARDDRVALNNEILGSMKVIKIQAWEENFRSKLMKLRQHELTRLWRYFFAGACSVSMYGSTPLLVALGTFAAYTLSGNNLDVAEALTALALFDILRFPLFMLPQIINRIVEAGISFERVREFLLAEEYTRVGEGNLEDNGEVWIQNGTFVYDSKKPRLDDDDEDDNKNGAKGLRGLMLQHQRIMQEAALDRQWEKLLLQAQLLDAEDRIQSLEQKLHPKIACSKRIPSNPSSSDHEGKDKWSPSSLLSLRRVCMYVKPGEFVAVVGGVGAGKSTLINSILGEGRPLTGTGLAVKGKLAAFLQTPFIMNDTVENNILFGHSSPEGSDGKDGVFSDERYELALKACSLSHDLSMLPYGDQTEIGEKGITLSGGQKARVALARCFYHDADIYLLDDPIAAVDSHVAKELFHSCIVDEMLLGRSKGKKEGDRNASVILVTNALQFLSHPKVDKIICLNDGCVEEVGTYQQLSSDPSSRFSSFLKIIAETSKASIQKQSSQSEAFEVDGIDDASENGMDYGNEPEVAKVIDPSPRRKSSVKVTNEIKGIEDDGGNGGKLMTDEFKEREKGSVDKRVYIDWAKQGGGIGTALLILFMFAFVELLSVGSKWWLTHWSESGGSDPLFFLGIYAVINFSAIFATFVRLILFMTTGLRSSRAMFEKLLDTVLCAPMSFFDTTPIGRIINRFSKDMYTIDEQLVVSSRSYLSTMASVISTIFVVVSVTPYFLAGLVPIMIFYLSQQAFFTQAYRELRRLDSVTRSPIYALLGETLDGVLTIRAFEAQDKLNTMMINMLNVQQTAYHLTFASQCWISVRLEFAGTMIVMCACFVSVLSRHRGDELFAGLAGLSISFALSITQSLNWTVRMASDLEANMIAVERIQQYYKIPSEAPRLYASDDSLPTDWPQSGKIEFFDVKLRYRPGLPLVLKGLELSIPARSKVGVVGRTGAGKSTLMTALLRIVELDSGSIKIDGVDISKVGLTRLRSKVAVIPQDPVLFSGTVRSNLDPFDEHDDARLFGVLNSVGLYSHMARVSSKTSLSSTGSAPEMRGGRTQPIKSLSDEISEGGNNYSVGQRQLLVIARAMLAKATIVIMDEATASVDADTDARIQCVLRDEFKFATCITVAHRLNTIMDSDFVLVMDNGRAAEFDSPSSLLSKGGMFKSLVDAWEEET